MEKFRSKLRICSGVAAFALLTGLTGISAAQASTYVGFDDLDIGNLSGPNPASIVDGQQAELSVQLQNVGGVGLIPNDSISATLGGVPIIPNILGSEPGFSATDYLAGFSFTLGNPASIAYAPDTTGENFELVSGVPTVTPIGDLGTPYDVSIGSIVGTPGQLFFSDLAAGQYTLLFSGTAIIPPTGFVTNGPEFGGTISAVPLPATLPMFAVGLVGLGLRARRRVVMPT